MDTEIRHVPANLRPGSCAVSSLSGEIVFCGHGISMQYRKKSALRIIVPDIFHSTQILRYRL